MDVELKNKHKIKLKTIIICVLLFFTGCTSFIAIFRTPDWSQNRLKYKIDSHNMEREFEKKSVIVRYAPIINQYTLNNTRKDFLADYDYDNDENTSNSRNNVGNKKLKATIHYSIVETSTHYFITYLLYHISDGWSDGACKYLTYWFGGQHENDGENIQIVVEKSNVSGKEEIVIIGYQNHNDTDFLIHPKFKKGEQNPDYKSFKPVNFKTSQKLHPVFFLEPGKHAIYANPDEFSCCTTDITNYTITQFSPVTDINNPGDFWNKNQREFKYQFKSIKFNLWDRYVEGKAIWQHWNYGWWFRCNFRKK